MPRAKAVTPDLAALKKTENQILKSLARLQFSVDRTRTLSAQVELLSDTDLEAWEGLLSRFARTADLFLSKYVRMRVLYAEPGFRGATRDYLNQAAKLGVIQDVDRWLAIKELRNRQAHDYEDEDLAGLFQSIRAESEELLKIKEILAKLGSQGT